LTGKLRIRVTDKREGAARDIAIDPTEGSAVVGRGPECRIELSARTVSREHLLFEAAAQGWTATDISMLGTLRNGLPMAKDVRTSLEVGDRLTIVDYEIEIVAMEERKGERSGPIPIESLLGEAEEEGGPAVRVTGEGREPKSFPLGEEGSSLLVGRSRECAIVVEDPLRVISSVHAKITRDWAGIFVYDLSKNGVFVNGEKIENFAPLEPGDRITLASPRETTDYPVLLLEGDVSSRGAEETAAAGEVPEETVPAPPEPLPPPEAPETPEPEPAREEVAALVPGGGSNLFLWVAVGAAVIAVIVIVVVALMYMRG